MKRLKSFFSRDVKQNQTIKGKRNTNVVNQGAVKISTRAIEITFMIVAKVI